MDDKKNGFRDYGPPVADTEHPDDVTLRHVRYAQYILASKGSYVPSLEMLRKLGETKTQPVETVDSITDKIKELKRQHAQDLQNLFKFQADEYHQELVDHHLGFDESTYMDIDEAYPDQVAFKQALEEFDGRVRKMDRLKRDMDDALSTLRYTHLKTLNHLIMKRSGLKSQEMVARQKRDAWFPQTPQQYHAITERDHQLRVARFLTSDSSSEQDKMMDEYQWPYRTVHPLLQVYKNDAKFRSEVRGALSGLFVGDPRRRGTKGREEGFTRFSPL